MDYRKLKASIKEVAEVASSVPEQFRDKCFELLLTALLAENKPDFKHEDRGDIENKPGDTLPEIPGKPAIPSNAPVALNSSLRILIRKTGVAEAEINKILFVEGDQVHFIQTPKTRIITDGQLEWSLLLALKNAILKNALETDPEEVRSKCQDVGFYDPANFAANFKREKFTKLFKGTLVSQGDAKALTPEGQDALGALIKKLAGEAK